MGRINPEDAELYDSSLNGEWFQLKNDKDQATVQFMYDKYSDLDTYVTHKLAIDGKDRHVNCLRENGDPLDVCPLCAAGFPAKSALFVMMFQHDDNKVKIWERGKQFRQKLERLCSRYNPLSSKVFGIERIGVAGDTKTQYDVFTQDQLDAYDLSEVERPELLGGIIMDKEYGELQYFVENGVFPPDPGSAPAAPQLPRRGGAPAATTPQSRRGAAPAGRGQATGNRGERF